ncbi:F0F1 ATP synthase subunit B' [Curvivirga sp.]|uniref:F0F1 ATP synthase subunit B family protein n=1 Tax=Curvivirga sp. TaxID=2856848 RepID=UPI003B5C44E5
MANIKNTLLRITAATAVVMPAAAQAAGGMPQLDPTSYPSQIFWLAVSFAILFLVMWKVALPRVGETLANRQQKLTGDLEKAEQLKADAEKVQEDLDKALADARAEAHAVLAKAADEIAQAQQKRMDAFEADMASQAEEAEKRISAAREQAMASVREVATEVAASVVEKLSGTAADAKALDKALDAAKDA